MRIQLDELNLKKEKYQKILHSLKVDKQNKWVPAPKYIQIEEEKKDKLINEDIPENTVRIIIVNTNYVRNYKIYLKITVPDTKIEEKIINQKAPGDWSTPFDINIPDKSTFRNFLLVILLLKYMQKNIY